MILASEFHENAFWKMTIDFVSLKKDGPAGLATVQCIFAFHHVPSLLILKMTKYEKPNPNYHSRNN